MKWGFFCFREHKKMPLRFSRMRNQKGTYLDNDSLQSPVID